MLSFTDYRISTMTATGYIGMNVNLDAFYEHVIIVDFLDKELKGIVYAEYGNNKHSQVFKGTNIKKKDMSV